MKEQVGNPETGSGNMIENMKEKLFLPWNIDGEPNLEYLNFLVGMDTRLKDEPGYIAVGGFGSQFKGYADESSDFDVIVLRHRQPTSDPKSKDVLDEKVGIAATESVIENKHRIGGIQYYYEDIQESLSENNVDYTDAIEVLANHFVGHTEVIQGLIEKLRTKHHLLMKESPDKAKGIFINALRGIIVRDLGVYVVINMKGQIELVDDMPIRETSAKIQLRRENEKRFDIDDIATARTLLWAQRLNEIMQTNYEFSIAKN